MKKEIQRSVWVLAGIGVVLVVALSVFFFSRDEKKKIADFVTANQTELESIVLDCLAGEETIAGYKGVEVDGVYSGEHQIVQFNYSGSGLAPSTTYYGFYYSKDNVPAAFQNVNVELTSTSADEWMWDDGTGNSGVTERIAEGWFYYEASF